MFFGGLFGVLSIAGFVCPPRSVRRPYVGSFLSAIRTIYCYGRLHNTLRFLLALQGSRLASIAFCAGGCSL